MSTAYVVSRPDAFDPPRLDQGARPFDLSTANHISAHNLPKRFSADQASLHVVSCDNLPVPATPSSVSTTYPSDRAEKCSNDTTNSVSHERLLYEVRLC